MSGKTHLAFGIGISVIAAGCLYPDEITNGILTVGTCILGSILPDIDNHNSMVGNKVKLLSRTINKMFGHRNLIHSPIFIIGMYFLLKMLINKYEFEYGMPMLYGFIIGYLGHIILDCMTRGGIPIFYPFLRKRFKMTFMKSGRGYEGIVAGAVYSVFVITFVFLKLLTNI